MTNANQPAFPGMEHYPSGRSVQPSLGLTKREFFAAFSMLGHFVLNERCMPSEGSAEKWAKGSVLMADALLRELQKSESSKAPEDEL